MMDSKYTKEETLHMIAECDEWFHQINVGHGIITPGSRDCSIKLAALNIPEDLTDWTVLDIGANDGFYSFECETRGASRVLATDYPHWTGDVEYLPPEIERVKRKDHFETARKLRNSSVEDKTISIYDLNNEELGTFNLVMLYGVLYHLVHITIGLERAIQMCNRLIIIESAAHKDNRSDDLPLMLYEPTLSSWWYPNAECLKKMMLFFGCDEVKIISHPEFPRLVLHGYKNGYEGK